MKQRPKRKRRIDWVRIGWLALALNLVLGFAFSPVTSVRRIRVVGAYASETTRIADVSQTLRGVPALRSSPYRLVSLVEASDSVERARFSQNVFGRGVLLVKMREPVAVLRGSKNVMLSDQGVFFTSVVPRSDLPRIGVPSAELEPTLTIAGSIDLTRLAELCRVISKELPKGPWMVERNSRGMISLMRNSPCRVVLGTSDRLPEKIGLLVRVLRERPQILEQSKEVNLTAPSNPGVVPLAPTSQP